MNILIGILSLVCLASAFITFGLGIEVFFKRPTSALHRVFFLMMLCGTYWGIGEFMIWQVGTAEGAWFWLKASSFWPFTLAFTLLFSVMFTRPEQYSRHRGLTTASIFIPAALISYFLLFTDLVYSIRPLSETSFSYQPVAGSIVYPVYAGSVFLMMLVVILVFFTYWRHASTRVIANQAPFLDLTADAYAVRKARVLANWDRIQAIAATVPDAAEIAGWLRRAGGPTTPAEVGLDAEEYAQGIAYAHYYRPRFTVAKLSQLLGLASV